MRRWPLILIFLAAAGPPSAPRTVADTPASAPLEAKPTEPVWEITLPAAPTAAPRAVASGERVLLALEERLELRDAEDGGLIWSRVLPPGAFVSVGEPLEEGGPGVAAWTWSHGDAGGLEVVGLARGGTRLETKLPEPPLGPALPPALAGEPWLVPLLDRIAVVGDDGRPRPGPELAGTMIPPLLRVAGQPVAALENGRLQPLSLPTGRRTARNVEPGAAVTWDGELYAVRDRTLRAWRCRVTRRERLRCYEDWSQRLGAAVTAPPAIAGELVIVGSWDTFLYAFDRDTGHLRWRRRVERRLRSRLLIDGPLVAVAIRDPAQVRAFQAAGGGNVLEIGLPPEEVLPFGPSAAASHLLTTSVNALDGRAVLRAWPWRGGSQSSPRKADSKRDSMSP
jgi:hypothetical protein